MWINSAPAWREGHSVFARIRKKRNLHLGCNLIYLMVFAFVYILGWAAIFNKRLGVTEEAEGKRKHVPEPK